MMRQYYVMLAGIDDAGVNEEVDQIFKCCLYCG